MVLWDAIAPRTPSSATHPQANALKRESLSFPAASKQHSNNFRYNGAAPGGQCECLPRHLVPPMHPDHALNPTARATPRSLARYWPWLVLAGLALAAFALRAWTLRLNLPYVDHPDEPNPINYVLGMLRTGDPNPHFFQKPSLYVYLLLAALGPHYRWGLAQGLYAPLDQMTITTHIYTTIPGFFLWGRTLTAAIGALTVISVGAVGKRIAGWGAGLLAALFLALAPFHLRHSQYVTTDVTTAWLVLLAFGAALAVAQGSRWRDYLAAGAFVGLAASTKYNAGIAALMVVAAHILAARRQSLMRFPRLLAAGAAAAVGFFAGTPYALLSWGEFTRGILGQVKDYSETAHGDFTGAWNVAGYVDFFTHDGLGWLAALATLTGLALLLLRPTRPGQRAAGILWLSFVAPYVLLHMAQSSHFNRNMVAVVVLAALPIGVTGARVATICQKQKQLGGLRHLAAALCCLALVLPGALDSWAYTQRLRRGDTRVQSLAWLDANVPPGARIAAELRPLPGAPESRWAEVAALPAHDLAWYRRQGYAFLVGSSDAWRQWDIPAPYRQLAGAPVAEFGGPDLRWQLGPHLAIYATGLTSADAPMRLTGDAIVGGAHFVGFALGTPNADAPTLGLEPARRIAPGQTLALRTFWQVAQPFTTDYFIFVHLRDATGATVAQRDTPPWQGRFPTSTWRANTLIVDVNDLPLPANLAPGEYSLVVGMFDPASGGHPPTSINGQPTDALEIGRITIGQ